MASEAPLFVIAEVSEPRWPDTLVAAGSRYSIEHGAIRRLTEVPRGDGSQFNALLARGPLPPGARESVVTPSVSVILPTFNRARFLPEAFASITAQSWPHWSDRRR